MKANQNFLQLQEEIADVENKLAAVRRYFNSATKEYNNAVQTFPIYCVSAAIMSISPKRLRTLAACMVYPFSRRKRAARTSPAAPEETPATSSFPFPPSTF